MAFRNTARSGAQVGLLVLLAAGSCACGGGGSTAVACAPPESALAFTFECWGTISGITDGLDDPATLPDVAVGDTVVIRVSYDPATFGPGEGGVISGGFAYPAPTGLEITLETSSGGQFAIPLAWAAARYSAPDGWWWLPEDSSLNGVLRADDATDTSFESPLPNSFEYTHTLFLNKLDRLEPSLMSHLRVVRDGLLADWRTLHFGNQLWTVLTN